MDLGAYTNKSDSSYPYVHILMYACGCVCGCVCAGSITGSDVAMQW